MLVNYMQQSTKHERETPIRGRALYSSDATIQLQSKLRQVRIPEHLLKKIQSIIAKTAMEKIKL
jgi:hypothetical protein